MNPVPLAWTLPPEAPALTPGVVHAWLLSDAFIAAAAAQNASLADDEHARAARLTHARAHAFTGIRATLRRLLSLYTGESAAAIQIADGPLGKPSYEGGGVQFSISHAGDLALLAFSRTHALGADIEKVLDNRRFDALTARFFSHDNARTVALSSPSGRARVFAEAWAQREAYVKAVGGGLYATPDVLPFSPAAPPIQRIRHPASGDPWTIVSLDAGKDYAARLVVDGEPASYALYRPSI